MTYDPIDERPFKEALRASLRQALRAVIDDGAVLTWPAYDEDGKFKVGLRSSRFDARAWVSITLKLGDTVDSIAEEACYSLLQWYETQRLQVA
jgi:hypothetical protein